MDLPANAFKRAIASGTRVHGTWLVSGAASTAEALGCAGFDFLVVDTEHTPIETPQVAEILRTIAGTPASAIVRPAWNDMVLIKRLLDAGAQSLLVPFVQSAEEARRAVSYTRYPPDGVRGVAAVQRGSRFGTVPNYLKGAGAEICVIVQIETLTALDALPQIATVPGVDSIFVGPGDLAASLGHLGDIANPAVQSKLELAAQACRKAGKPCGIVGPNPQMVGKFIEYGYTWVAVNSDLGMMVSRAQEWLAQIKRDAPA
jgi:4-hydroxy-2-oxoheptanedioate aldolase